MKIFSLARLADEAAYIADNKRNQLGAIQDPKTFEQSFAALDRSHRGAFAFLAFHPASDTQVIDYIAEGSLGSDAGPRILALFLAGPAAPHTPRELQPSDCRFGVELSPEMHPSYELARHFFVHAAVPALPGLIVFDKLLSPKNAIYVPLTASDKAGIRSQCRKALSTAQAASVPAGEEWLDFDRFAAGLFDKEMPYYRAGEKGLRSAALITVVWLKKNAAAIVSIVPKALELAAKSKPGAA
jgi:hypothetical protein